MHSVECSIICPLRAISSKLAHYMDCNACAGDKRKITRTGGVVWDGLGDDLKRLALVRGLRNDTGLNNCFLNVVIQSLWHLRPFRQALLALDLEVSFLQLQIRQCMHHRARAKVAPSGALSAVLQEGAACCEGERETGL